METLLNEALQYRRSSAFQESKYFLPVAGRQETVRRKRVEFPRQLNRSIKVFVFIKYSSAEAGQFVQRERVARHDPQFSGCRRR